tara:strand:+ start:96 stop:626 length:531 start_codon:yes stop_codon:yes gene_type:complete
VSLLITCFEDFSTIKENTSRLVASQLSEKYQVLPVSFTRCDENIIEHDHIIQLGVAQSRDAITIERYAHNLAHSPIQADNDLLRPENEKILKEGPLALESTFDYEFFEGLSGDWKWSLSAGSYVCNALYYKSLYRLTKSKIVFIHLPYHLNQKSPELALEAYRDFVQSICNKIKSF